MPSGPKQSLPSLVFLQKPANRLEVTAPASCRCRPFNSPCPAPLLWIKTRCGTAPAHIRQQQLIAQQLQQRKAKKATKSKSLSRTMFSPRSLPLLALAIVCSSMIAQSNAFGFGGGCGCPCLPQPCIPQPPPIALPSLCLPQIQLPCPPPPCGGCCGRKKRGAKVAIETRTGTKRLVNGGNNNDEKDGTNCNNPQMRRIILKNLVVGDAVGTKSAIHSELRAKLGGDYIVLCSTQSPTLSFAADSITNYCIEGHQAMACAAFQI